MLRCAVLRYAELCCAARCYAVLLLLAVGKRAGRAGGSVPLRQAAFGACIGQRGSESGMWSAAGCAWTAAHMLLQRCVSLVLSPAPQDEVSLGAPCAAVLRCAQGFNMALTAELINLSVGVAHAVTKWCQVSATAPWHILLLPSLLPALRKAMVEASASRGSSRPLAAL